MNIDTLIEQVRASLAAKLDSRSAHSKTIEDVRSACLAESRDPSDAEANIVRGASDAKVAIDAEVEILQARIVELQTEKDRDAAADKLANELHPTGSRAKSDPTNRIVEPRTYTEHTSARSVSFFSDAYSYMERGNASGAVAERLNRHAREVEVHNELTERAASTGSFAGLVVPQYLVDQAALVARAGRPVANTLQSLQIPEQGMSFLVPRGTTGASAAVQATENSSVSSTDQVWANVTVNVATVAGQQDISRQSIERGTPGIDSLVYMDLAGAYGVAVDQQVISGSGSSGQVLGILNTAGVNQATAFGAAATATTFYSKVAGQVNAVETTRFLAPNLLAMHPRRWNWLISQVDSSGRPLAVPNANGPFNALATFDSPQDTPRASAVGWFQGLPVVTDASIPTAVGTGPEDQVVVYRSSDLLLWEDGDGMPRELRFEQTLGNQLTVKLVVYGYIAFTAGRYPTAVGIVGGNAGSAGFGLVAPSF